MREICGDLWVEHALGRTVAITTGALLTRDGRCAMPRGCARQARDRFPGLDRVLGGQIASHGNHVFDLGRRIVSFPVENSPYEVPALGLIERSARELVVLTDYKGWPEVVLPRPGCGGGGLDWQTVRPLLAPLLDERFLVISQET